MSQRPTTNPSASPGVVGKLFATVFFAVFLGMGVFFFGIISRDVARALAPYRWTAAEAQVLQSVARDRSVEGVQHSDPYEFAVQYRYFARGRWFTSDRWSTKDAHFQRMDEAQRLATRFQPGEKAPCWVDPANPQSAILHRESPLFALILVFPLIFVAIGLGGIIAIWRRKAAPFAGTGVLVSERVKVRTTGTWLLRLFFGLFFCAGAAVLWFMTLSPALEVLAARSWEPTPARVISSRVAAHSDSDGNTYRVDILYAYTFRGRTYQSSRYDFSRGSSSGYGTKAAIVRQYPAGAETTCFVNPRDPTEAVLRRQPFKAMAFGAIGLVFLLIGAGGFYGAEKMTSGGQPVRTDGLPVETVPVTTAAPGAVVLRPTQTRRGKFVFTLFFTLFWNAFIGTFIYFVIVKDSNAPLFAKIILGVLALVGVALVFTTIHNGLAMFNPVVRLTINSAALPLGGRMDLQWTVEGQASKLQRLRVVLEGREEATYRRGTSTYTDREVFTRAVLLEAVDRAEIETGRTTWTVPPDSMHTFEGRNNKVLWRLHVTGDIPRWPDIDDEYPITILPAELPDVAQSA